MRHAPAWASAAILLGWGIPAAGQALAVSPTLVEIAPAGRGAVIDVTNNSPEPVDIQIRPYDWRDTDGHDVLTDSTSLRVSPSIATIAPGATQVVRVLAAPAAAPEREWRILLDQLPQPAKGGGLRVKLRMSIPVFAYASKTTVPDLRWSIVGGQLTATNVGQRYARFAALSVRNADGHESPLALDPTPYLLPGARRQWRVAATASRVVGRIGTTDFTAPITLDPMP